VRATSLFGQTLREIEGDGEIASHRLLTRAGYIRRLGAGLYSYLPLGLRALHRIATVLREEMDAIGGQEVSMPVVQPAALWRRSGRWDSIDPELVRFKDRRGHDMVVAMTHEEVATELARGEIRSYRELPAIVYQIQTKFRDQLRPRAGLVRAREFLMKDAYSFDRDRAGLERTYAAHLEAYGRIFRRLELPVTVVEADPGIMGGGTSQELTYLTPVGEDTLARCPSCGYAANLEAASAVAGDPCPRCGSPLGLVRGIEVAHAFQLGTRYTERMGATYVDETGEARPIVMGSYGIGLGRLLACLAEEYHDERGLTLPAPVAPFQVALLALGHEPEVGRRAEEVYRTLQASGVEVLFDDRDVRPGVKFADADLRGMPLRITISRRTLDRDSAELLRRREREPRLVSLDGLQDVVRHIIRA
jgi:prolyl-tRNA synthetase